MYAKSLSRRSFLNRASAALLYSTAIPLAAKPIENPSLFDYPFKLGVASGDPLPDGFVLWTRLAPAPYDDTALPPAPILVEWEVARDERMRKIVRRGKTFAKPRFAHSVHVEINGLEPATEYFYRFRCAGEVSPIGRTRTISRTGSPLERLRFAQVSCQSIHDGYYAAYRDITEQEIDFVLHLGDYVYESDYIADVRRIPIPEPKTLGEYRALHARYKQDPYLQKAHRHAPWLMIWDDHEVTNDHGGSYSEESTDPEVNRRRRIAGYQAYYEHMPLRLRVAPQNDTFRLYQRTVFGDLLQLDLLDFRQYRDTPACLKDDRYKERLISKTSCPASYSSQRTGLGWEQEKWFTKGFGYSGAKWSAFGQTTVFAPFDLSEEPGIQGEQDGWEGFAASRDRILAAIERRAPANPVSLGGDIHAYYAGSVHTDPYDFNSPPLVSELVCTSLTSGGGGLERLQKTHKILSAYPHDSYFENRYRGYLLNTVTPDSWSAECRNVVNLQDPESKLISAKTLTIESGKVGVRS